MIQSSTLSFLTVVGIFISATAVSICYQLDMALVNLCLSMMAVLGLNQFKLCPQALLASGLVALILAGVAIIIPARVWNVWLFVLFIASVWGLSNKKNASNDKCIVFIAIFFNLSVITNTKAPDIQYDFLSCFNYIEYILENNFLFWQENPLLSRPSYSTYHPILHFFLAAGVIRIVQFFTLNATAPTEAVQVLFCSYMLWYYFIVARILQLLNLRQSVYLVSLAFCCFFPFYNALAGFFNNDCLLLPLQAGTVYYALLYYRNGTRKNLLFIFLFASAASLTKLSGVLVLPMVAVALSARLWQNRDKKTFYELAIFGACLIVGISIWPLYQHFALGISAEFVPPQEHLSLKSYTLWERFNPIQALVYEKMFYNDFGSNLWETMTKTALFGQWDFSFRGAQIMDLIILFVLLYKAILVIISLFLVYLLFIHNRNIYVWFTVVLLFSLLGGHVGFGLLHPYMCNQDFRYVAVLCLPMAMIWGLAIEHLPPLWRKLSLFPVIFSGVSAFIWWYVVSFGG